MRYCWVDAGNDPNYDKGDLHSIEGWFMPLWDARTTKGRLLDIQARGFSPGVYVGHGWVSIDDPQQYADRVYAEYQRVFVPYLRLQVNLEQHEPEKIAQTLEALRAKKTGMQLSWTLEGMQGGWAGSIAARVQAAKVRVVPQSFWGASGRIDGRYAEDMVLRDLTRRGYSESLVSLFYDAKALPRDWQGFAFTMGRLP
jgi:hypothetical protein